MNLFAVLKELNQTTHTTPQPAFGVLVLFLLFIVLIFQY
jgi:hypothetical protein